MLPEPAIEVRWALQKALLAKYKIIYPHTDHLIEAYSKVRHALSWPDTPEGVELFINSPAFQEFIEPAPGLVRLRSYDSDFLKSRAIELKPAKSGAPWMFEDQRGWLWAEVEERIASVAGGMYMNVFRFLGDGLD